MSRRDLTDREGAASQPLLPNSPRGVPRIDDCRVVGGIFVLCAGVPWHDLPKDCGHCTTGCNRWSGKGQGARFQCLVR